MTEVDIQRIEASAGFPLPAEYRKFLLDHSAEIRELESEPEAYGVYPWTEADEIIQRIDGSAPECFSEDIAEGEAMISKTIVIASDYSGG